MVLPLEPPILLPSLPDYPDLPQLVRVSAPSIGRNVYPSLTQQYAGNLTLRDREPCYAWEPNGVALSPAIYDCRLVGSYLSLPLYVPTCCISGSFSSSLSSLLSSSSGASGSPALTRIPLGTDASVDLVSGRVIQNVTTQTGIIEVVVATLGSGALNALTAYYNGNVLIAGVSVDLPLGAAIAGRLRTFYGAVGNTTADVVLELASGVAGFLTYVVNVKGLASGVQDDGAITSANGLLTAPDAGTSGSTSVAIEYANAAFAFLSLMQGTWENSFQAGQVVSGTYTGVAVTLQEGYRLLNAVTTIHPSLGGVLPGAWCGLGQGMK